MKTKAKLLGSGSLFLAAFIFGLVPLFSRTIGDALPVLYQSWTRALFCALILLFIFSIKRKQLFKFNREDAKWLLGRSFGGVISFTCFYTALNQANVAPVYLTYFVTYVIACYVFGAILFKERITRLKLISAFVALVGLWILYLGNMSGNMSNWLGLSILGSIGYAIWSTFNKKIDAKYTTSQLNFLDLLLAGFMYLILSLIMKEQWVMPNIDIVWLTSLAFGLQWIAVGYLVVWGFKRVEASVGSLVMLSEILFALIVGWAVYQEELSVNAWFGGALILFGISLPEVALLLKKK